MAKNGDGRGSGSVGSAIEDAVLVLPENFTPRHRHSRKCYRVLRHILYPKEQTVIEAKQSLMKSLSPCRLVATDQRVVFVAPSFFALWAGRNIFSSTRYESIPYSNIINIALHTGMVFSTLSIRLSTNANNGETLIEGLKTKDAEAMFAFLETLTDSLRKYSEHETEARKAQEVQDLKRVDLVAARRVISQLGSRFVWMGVEPAEYVAERLGVEREAILKIDLNELTHMNRQDSLRFRGCVLVCYTGSFAAYASKYLEQAHGIATYVLSGGIDNYPRSVTELKGAGLERPAAGPMMAYPWVYKRG